jgi:carbohydrate-selective porin OprB
MRRLLVTFAAVLTGVLAWAQVEENPQRPAATPPPPARVEADVPPVQAEGGSLWQQWAAAKQRLADRYGTAISLNFDAVERAVVSGDDEGLDRLISRYDLLVRQAVNDDARLSMQLRGGWGRGLDPHLGLFSNTDQYALTGEDLFVLHLYYEQQLFEDQLTLRLGKFDIGDWIDSNRFAFYNFLAYSLAHSPTIALTGNTLGAMATWEPGKQFYLSGGVSNSTQSPFETGFDSTFRGSSNWLSIAEIGVKPRLFGLEGVYRFIGWHNTRDFVTASGAVDSGASGFALSFDQDLVPERLGVFLRYGVNDGDALEPRRSYSAGLLLHEPIAGRKKDSLGLGFVLSEFSRERVNATPGGRSSETLVELYYNIQLTPWAQLQPLLQAVDNPGGADGDTVLIAGVHLALRF